MFLLPYPTVKMTIVLSWGSVDGWDFKQYVLGILFYRFISENLTHYINEHERKVDPNFDYAKI